MKPQTTICVKCGNKKLLNSRCKICLKNYEKAYYKLNEDKIKIRSKTYYGINKRKINASLKNYRKAKKEKITIYMKAYRKTNKDKLQIKRKIYLQANKKKINAYHKSYYKDKLSINPKYKLNHSISHLIWFSLKGNKNGWHWDNLVGYTLNDLKKHLEKQFTEGMGWGNYGKWHIDHEIPISVFNFTKPEHRDFKKCWALSNLQPMWDKENILKSNKLIKHFQPSLLL